MRRRSAEQGVVENRVADVAGGDGGAIGEWLGGREIFALPKHQPMSAVVRGGTEEPWENDASGDRALDRGGRIAGPREVKIVNEKGAGRCGPNQVRGHLRGATSGRPNGRVQGGVGYAAIRAKVLEARGSHFLRVGD